MPTVSKISTKIKILGLLLIILILGIISSTIYLNKQNAKDALIVNIAGKQRMLTQKIAKNIFYTHYTNTKDFYELNSAVDEFITGLNILRHGDKEKGIDLAPTLIISNQLLEVKRLWMKYYENIQNFKIISTETNIDRKKELDMIVLEIYKSNPILLDNVDKLVTFYTNYSEDKVEIIKRTQYIFIVIFLMIFTYAMLQLRSIESHIDNFMAYSKNLINGKNLGKLKPMKLEEAGETEIVEVGQTINCFIDKINSAMDYSNEALLQSQQASSKLEELTDEFDLIIGTISDSSLINLHLNNSEDIVIESTEELINSTKKLQKLKDELQKLTKSCQPKQ